MKANLLTGYFLPRERKGQQSCPVEVKTIRSGESLGTDRQLEISVYGEVFLRISLSDSGSLVADFTEPESVGLTLGYRNANDQKFHTMFYDPNAPKWE